MIDSNQSSKALHLFYITKMCVLSVFLCCSYVIKAQENASKINLIIDADTANEVDDLYAIVRAINEPKFNLLAITSAQFNTSPLATDNTVNESQVINEDIIRLMKKTDISLPLGSNTPLINAGEASSSPASRFIIEKAHSLSSNEKLDITILGSCTNVASAIIEDPTIIPKLRVHYIGFWHDVKANTYDKKEFNTGNDPIATNVLLNTKALDFNVMTATTSQHLVFKKKTVDKYLKGKKGIASYLVNRWETYERWWTKDDPEKKSWIMWDVAIIEALLHPELATKKQFLTPKENVQREIGVYTDINVKKMESHFWKHLKKLIE